MWEGWSLFSLNTGWTYEFVGGVLDVERGCVVGCGLCGVRVCVGVCVGVWVWVCVCVCVCVFVYVCGVCVCVHVSVSD